MELLNMQVGFEGVEVCCARVEALLLDLIIGLANHHIEELLFCLTV